MKRLAILACCAAVLSGICVPVMAQSGPVQLSLIPRVQLIHRTGDVDLVRLSVWGQNEHVTGLDLGIVNVSDGNFAGLGASLLNYVKGDSSGLQWGILNRTKGTVQHGQLGCANLATSVTGVQLGAVNFSNKIEGLQIGLLNHAKENAFLQIGAVNIARNTTGWQVGVINVNRSESTTCGIRLLVNGNF